MNSRPRLTARAGATLICVLVCVSVSTTIASSMIGYTLRIRRNERLQRQMVQTEFLLDAAVSRAASHLQRSPEYVGEVWRPATALPDYDDVRVDIEVFKDSEEADSPFVKVVARLATGVLNPVATQRSHTFKSKSAPLNKE